MAGRKATPPSPETDPNPSGLCGCGCGGQTNLVKWSDKTKGHVKGHHREFISGHALKRNGCIVVGCEGAHGGLGYCTLHYQRFKKHGSTELPPKAPVVCSVDGCENKAGRRSGLCKIHYVRKRKHGTTDLQPHWSKTEKRESGIAKISAANLGRKVSEDGRRRMSEGQKGKKLSAETRAKMSAARLGKKRKVGPTSERMLLHLAKARAVKGPTRLELAVRALLDSFGVEFIEQHLIGVYTVDFYIPKIGLVIEADGAYWHQSEARERARDKYLMNERNGVTDIVHLTEQQLKPWTPKDRFSTEYRTAILAA